MKQMRVAIGQFNELTNERLTFAAQLGVSGVLLNTPILPGEHRWEYADLAWMVHRCEAYGLRLEALENVPVSFYDRAMLGMEGRDAQIAGYQETIRHIGAAGIPILGYHWMPNGVWRTPDRAGRGGAMVTAFYADDLERYPLRYGIREHPLAHGRTFSAAQMWDNYCYFMERVLPVAEAAGVTLALHPDDPPLPELGGIARLFGSLEGFQRALDQFNSPHHGLDFCLGCWSEMGPDPLVAIRRFGTAGKICYVHFRDVQGVVPAFQECFLGEGNVDVVAAMRTLYEVGFDGFIIDDHVPQLIDDTTWGHRGRAHATGYLQALVAAVSRHAEPLIG
jgi:mannonate dehydratase